MKLQPRDLRKAMRYWWSFLFPVKIGVYVMVDGEHVRQSLTVYRGKIR